MPTSAPVRTQVYPFTSSAPAPAPSAESAMQKAAAVPSTPPEAPPAQIFSPEAPVVVVKGVPNMTEPHAPMKKAAAHPAATTSAAKTSVAVGSPSPAQDDGGVARRAGSSSGKNTAPPTTAEDAQEQPAATSPAADPNIQAAPTPVPANSVPAEFRPVRGRALASAAISSGPKPSATAQIPFFAAPAQVPIAIPLPKFKAESGSGPQERTSTAPQTEDPAPAERAAVNDAALEVRIKVPVHESDPKPPAATADPVPPAGPAAPVSAPPVAPEPVTLKPLPELPATQPAPQPVAALPINPAHAVAAEVTVRTPENPAHPPAQPATSTARSTDIEEPVATRETPQPLKSLSLEFSPDGAGDVRLRLSEKSGEVHISLHSPDASLTSRLHEGVHDLVGSLSSAGYEAEAWTPGQGHQNNQREPEQRKNRRADSKEAGEAFGDVFQQPIQEIS